MYSRFRSAFAALSLSERAFAFSLLASAALPPLASAYADAVDPLGLSLLGRLGAHPCLCAFGTLVVCASWLVCLERPKSLSLLGYLKQLGMRAADVQRRIDVRRGRSELTTSIDDR